MEPQYPGRLLVQEAPGAQGRKDREHHPIPISVDRARFDEVTGERIPQPENELVTGYRAELRDSYDMGVRWCEGDEEDVVMVSIRDLGTGPRHHEPICDIV